MNSTSGIDRRTLSAAMAGTALTTGCTTATNGHMNAAWLRGQDEAEHLRTILGTPALGCGIESRYCPNMVAAGNRMKGASVAVTAQDRWHWGGAITKAMTATLIAAAVKPSFVVAT
jgi:hypothetical protein